MKRKRQIKPSSLKCKAERRFGPRKAVQTHIQHSNPKGSITDRTQPGKTSTMSRQAPMQKANQGGAVPHYIIPFRPEDRILLVGEGLPFLLFPISPSSFDPSYFFPSHSGKLAGPSPSTTRPSLFKRLIHIHTYIPPPILNSHHHHHHLITDPSFREKHNRRFLLRSLPPHIPLLQKPHGDLFRYTIRTTLQISTSKTSHSGTRIRGPESTLRRGCYQDDSPVSRRGYSWRW